MQMEDLIDCSDRYILAVEYESSVEKEVEYRGHSGKLWKRPYGILYEQMGLKPVMYWNEVPGFDRCAAWLFEK